jgi:hypothetical protein
MFLLVAGLLFIASAGLILNPLMSLLCLAGLGIFSLQFFAALLKSPAPAPIWKAIPKIPVFVWRQVLAVMKIQASKNDFMATDHTENTEIEDVWARRKNDFPYLKEN